MAQAHGDRLTSIDASFLAQEGPTSHMHVGAVMIFDGPPPGYVEFVNQVRGRLHLVPRYRQKLAIPPIETGRPVWIDDPSFNLEYHIRHTALPSPGSEEQLRSLAARIHSQQLDRAKPLWETWLVQGLEGNRFALISKTHHALVDGIAGVDLATVLFDAEPNPPKLPHEGEPWRPQPEPSSLDLAARGIRGLVRTPFELAGRAASAATRPSETFETTREAIEGVGEIAWATLNPAPATPLNVEIGPHRRVHVPARGARRLPARQERVRRHRQRRRADRRLRRPAEVAALARHAHRGARAARARPDVDPQRRRPQRDGQPAGGDARAAARLRRGPGRAPARRARRDGRAEGVQAGGRRGGARGRAELHAADGARAGLAAELLDAPVQPARDQRAGPAVPALRARAPAPGPLPGRVPAAQPRARGGDHVLQRLDGLRPARRLRRHARPRGLRDDGRRLAHRADGRREEAAALERQRAGGEEEARGGEGSPPRSRSQRLSSRARTSRPRTSCPGSTAA